MYELCRDFGWTPVDSFALYHQFSSALERVRPEALEPDFAGLPWTDNDADTNESTAQTWEVFYFLARQMEELGAESLEGASISDMLDGLTVSDAIEAWKAGKPLWSKLIRDHWTEGDQLKLRQPVPPRQLNTWLAQLHIKPPQDRDERKAWSVVYRRLHIVATWDADKQEGFERWLRLHSRPSDDATDEPLTERERVLLAYTVERKFQKLYADEGSPQL